MVLSFGTASADTISVSQVIHITGVVPPMRYIIVNPQGNIVEITSNTPENVTPKVILDSFQNGTELPLTSATLKDYESKIQGKDMRSTELHFALPNPQTAKSSSPAWLRAISHISQLRFPSLL